MVTVTIAMDMDEMRTIARGSMSDSSVYRLIMIVILIILFSIKMYCYFGKKKKIEAQPNQPVMQYHTFTSRNNIVTL